MSNDVEFTYRQGNQMVTRRLPWSERISSREALGLWKVNVAPRGDPPIFKAWKVYQTTNQYNKLFADYQRAGIHAGLPMGNYAFTKGKVKRSNRTTDGFVLATEWMEGANFQNSASSFQTALGNREFPIPKDRNNQDYTRTKAGCDAAKRVGLRDPQGFVKAGIYEPLRFIDIHTSWNERTRSFDSSQVANDLVNVIDRWPTN